MIRMVLLLGVVTGGILADNPKSDEKKELVAVVKLVPHNITHANVTGDLKIVQTVANGPVKITGKVYNLTEGLHGFHVHERGDLSNGCTSTGGHFNPENLTHGAPEDKIRHVGDLGNIKVGADGIGVVEITDTIISLSGPNNILGRAFVVHSGEDDLGKGNSTLSATTGNAGDRLACGVIGVLSPTGRWSTSGFAEVWPNTLFISISFISTFFQLHRF